MRYIDAYSRQKICLAIDEVLPDLDFEAFESQPTEPGLLQELESQYLSDYSGRDATSPRDDANSQSSHATSRDMLARSAYIAFYRHKSLTQKRSPLIFSISLIT